MSAFEDLEFFENYALPRDIAYRLFRRHRIWFTGKPQISLHGESGQFGKLRFDFGNPVVEYRIFIRDRSKILNAAHLAVENFEKLMQEIILERC